MSLQHLFLALYVTSLLLLVAGASRIGARLYRTRWAVAALGAALTLRHAIAKTGANTLEGYFHPRQLAFALGRDRGRGVSRAAGARRRRAAPVGGAGAPDDRVLVHGVARRRRLVRPSGMAPGADRVRRRRWSPRAGSRLWRGPLAGRLAPMDADWLAVIGDQDYLFPLAWPVDVWVTNLIAVPVIVFCWRARTRAGLTVPARRRSWSGALALAVIFFALAALQRGPGRARRAAAGHARVLDDRLPRDHLSGVGDRGRRRRRATGRRAAIAAAVILALSTARGVYGCFIQFPDRRVLAIDVQHDDWRDAMAFARTTDPAAAGSPIRITPPCMDRPCAPRAIATS